ncbi:MAG TPA: hemerythrin domain-containing protein [Polyangiaceae bacterium]|nr:hemerythrin domain-containing protein [Polyangiaceae bacterium]
MNLGSITNPVRATGGTAPAGSVTFRTGTHPARKPSTVVRPASNPEGPLASLIDRIVGHHHAHTRCELDRLAALAASVGAKDRSLPGVARAIDGFATLECELRAHMTKEEVVIFPYIASLEWALRTGRTPVRSPFSALERPLRTLLEEQGEDHVLLDSIRKASSGYAPPPGASSAIHAFYEGLAALEAVLDEHGRIETEALFPGALELEQSALG